MLIELWNNFSQKEKFNEKLQNRLGNNYNTQNYLEQMCNICNDVDQILKHAKLNKQDILALILYTSWSFEVIDKIKDEINNTLSLSLDTSTKYKDLNKFNKAIRSFLIAHPLDTTQTRHSFLNLDGQYICLDIYPIFPKHIRQAPIKYLTFKALKNTPNKNKTYVYFKVYNTTKNNQDPSFQKYFGLSIEDLITCIKECIKTLDTFNKILKKEVR